MAAAGAARGAPPRPARDRRLAVAEAIEGAWTRCSSRATCSTARRWTSRPLTFAIERVRVAGCPPVFIAPGNHDRYSPASAYWTTPAAARQPAGVAAARARLQLAGVHRGRAAGPPRACRIWGRCSTPTSSPTSAPLARAPRPDARGRASTSALPRLARGLPAAGQAADRAVLRRRVAASPFDYLAVGHYHEPRRACDDAGGRRAARLRRLGGSRSTRRDRAARRARRAPHARPRGRDRRGAARGGRDRAAGARRAAAAGGDRRRHRRRQPGGGAGAAALCAGCGRGRPARPGGGAAHRARAARRGPGAARRGLRRAGLAPAARRRGAAPRLRPRGLPPRRAAHHRGALRALAARAIEAERDPAAPRRAGGGALLRARRAQARGAWRRATRSGASSEDPARRRHRLRRPEGRVPPRPRAPQRRGR